jgi:uncharacterized membrane protein
MFSLFSKKAVQYFTDAEQELIVQAIRDAEKSTSGEVRVYIESRCTYVDPLRRAKEIFGNLKMQETAARNATLVYVAMKDKQLAVFGDEGIHQKVGDAFWNTEVQTMLVHFNQHNYASGIAGVVRTIGKALETHFPYDAHTDKNELPDEIVFGK